MGYSPNFRGKSATITSGSVGGAVDNNSGLTLVRATPIRIDGNGDAAPIDVSVEAQAIAVVGVSLENVIDGSSGTIVTSGKVENITTTANNGDVLYVSKTGGLTNTQPSIGIGGFVAGDFIIRIGTLFKNVETPSQQDLLLNVSIVGQL